MFLPCFLTERLIPSKCNWEIRLVFVPNNFICIADKPDADVKMVIEKLELQMIKISLTDKAQKVVEQMLAREQYLSLPFLNVPNLLKLLAFMLSLL